MFYLSIYDGCDLSTSWKANTPSFIDYLPGVRVRLLRLRTSRFSGAKHRWIQNSKQAWIGPWIAKQLPLAHICSVIRKVRRPRSTFESYRAINSSTQNRSDGPSLTSLPAVLLVHFRIYDQTTVVEVAQSSMRRELVVVGGLKQNYASKLRGLHFRRQFISAKSYRYKLEDY